MKKAFITGILGQDGFYLTKFLLEKGYEVWGMMRRSSSSLALNEFTKEFGNSVKLRYGDMTDPSSLRKIIKECMPDEIYNLAAQSHVRISFDVPEYTMAVNGMGVIYLLDAVKEIAPMAHTYQASTSELMGRATPPQNETTPFYPRSPYGVAKLQAYWAVVNYREAYNLFACQGILYNHESIKRSENFVTRKITKAVAKYALKKQKVLYLGNLDSKRDWGHSKDYTRAMWLINNYKIPTEFVIATGETHTIREFLEHAFKCINIDIVSNGKSGVEEVYIDKSTGEVVVEIDPRLYRPTEVDVLQGDATKAKTLLGWKSEVSFQQLVEMMVKSDYENEKNSQ